jgi:hypothetical protein
MELEQSNNPLREKKKLTKYKNINTTTKTKKQN